MALTEANGATRRRLFVNFTCWAHARLTRDGQCRPIQTFSEGMAESRRKTRPRIRLATGGEKLLPGPDIKFNLESDCVPFFIKPGPS